MSPSPSPPFFISGGTLSADAPSYVARAADGELRDALAASQYCYVLNTRQVGKSSLIVRTAKALRATGRTTIALDITAGGFQLTPEAWYDGLLLQLAEQLARATGRPELEDLLEGAFLRPSESGPARRFFQAIETVALPAAGEGGLTIFLDEIDAVRLLPFSADELFVGIRALYNRRPDRPELNGLTFCLVGVATPAQLIADPLVSPFNIGRKIVLADFDLQEAASLARNLPGGEATLRRALYWTGGHPYLTQRLCAALAESRESVDATVGRLFFGRSATEIDDNLGFVAARLLRSGEDLAALLELYRRVRLGKTVPDEPGSSLCDTLHLAGIVRLKPDGALAVRNRIYTHVFGPDWIRENLPGDELRRQRAAFRRGALRTAALAGGVVAGMGGLTALALHNARLADRSRERADREAGVAKRWALVSERDRQKSAASLKHAEASQRKAEQLAEERERALREKKQALQEKEAALQEKERALLARERALGAEREARVRADQAALSARRNLGRAELALGLRALGNAETEAARAHFQDALHKGELPAPSRDLARYCLDALRLSAPTRLRQLACPSPAGLLVYSPDGRRLAVGTHAGSIHLFDLASGRAVGPVYRQGARVTALAFLPDGRLISGGADSRVFVWGGSRPVGPLVHTVTPGAIFHLAVRDDGRYAISSGVGGSVVWDLATGREVSRLWDDDTGGPWTASRPSKIPFTMAAAFCEPQGLRYAFGAYGYVSNLADAVTGKMIAPLTTARGSRAAPDWIYQLVSSPRPGVVAAVGHYRDGQGNGGACLYDLKTGHALSALMPSVSFVRSGAFRPDGAQLAVGTEDGTILLWEPEKNAPPEGPYSLFPAKRTVAGLAWLPDGDRIAATTGQGPVILWSRREQRAVGFRLPESFQFALSPDGHQLATSFLSAGGVSLWRVPERPKRRVWRFLVGDAGLNHESVALDTYAWASWLDDFREDGIVLDMRARQILRQNARPDASQRIGLSPDKRFACLYSAGIAEVWNLDTETCIGTKEIAPPSKVRLQWGDGTLTLKSSQSSYSIPL